MSSLPARRLGVFTAALLTVGLLAPPVVSAAPTGSAATFGQRGDDEGAMSAFSTAPSPIEVRDLSYACPEGRVEGRAFTDVPKGSTFAPAIDCLVWYRITYGKTATSYAPADRVTRQQMALFLYRMLDDIIVMPGPPDKFPFHDVPPSGEAAEAINILGSAELADMLGVRIVTGTRANYFDRYSYVTRAQMASFIARALEGVFHATGVSITDRGDCGGVFRDEHLIPDSHRDNVELLCAFGIVTGRTDGTYGPAADVNRGQMAAFLTRLMDLFVEAEVTVPPDFLAEIHVDRGTATTACSNAGRDGTAAKPFCTIQKGVDTAAAMSGRWVDVLVAPQAVPYQETIVLSSGSAYAVDLYSSELEEVQVVGSIEISGDAEDANYVWGFWVTSPTATPAFGIRTAGYAELEWVTATGDTAIRVDQPGVTGILDSLIEGGTSGLDLVATDLDVDGSGTWVSGTLFRRASAFVRAPGEGIVVEANLSHWMVDNSFTYTPQLETVDGRRAITPIS